MGNCPFGCDADIIDMTTIVDRFPKYVCTGCGTEWIDKRETPDPPDLSNDGDVVFVCP